MKIPDGIKPALILLIFLSLASALMTGCDTPLSGKGDGGSDSLDAESGRERFNRYDFRQGNLFSTGKVLDLALSGNGMFILENDSRKVYFRRPAAFIQDADGYLILGNGKTRLQGIPLSGGRDPYAESIPDYAKADSFELAKLSDIRWAYNDVAPPRATTEIRLAGNLDSDSPGKGSILYTQKFLHPAEGADIAAGLTNRNGHALGMKSGDILTFSARNGSTTATQSLRLAATTTLADIAAAMTDFLRSAALEAGPGAIARIVDIAEDSSLGGAITLYGNSAPIADFQVISNRPVSGPWVTKAFAVAATVPAGAPALAVTTETLRAPAAPADPLSGLFDSNGNRLGLENGDAISFSGSIGDDQAHDVADMVYAAGAGGITMQDLIDRIKTTFRLPDRDGTPRNDLSVSLNAAGTDDNIADGSLVIRGQPEGAFAIQDISIRAMDINNAKPSPNFFNTNMNITTLRDATDSRAAECPVTVYDGLGKEHRATLKLVPTALPRQWVWEASLARGDSLAKGGKGRLAFGMDGSLSAFSFEDGGSRLEFDPGNGSGVVGIQILAGGPGDFSGLTQFRSPTTASLAGQDGFGPGMLTQIAVSQDGKIQGSYTNGRSRPLFQIPLADFPNESGLKQVGGNSFLESVESGKPRASAGFGRNPVVIAPGALEFVTEEERGRLCEMHLDCPGPISGR